MSVSFEHQLICKILETKDIHSALKVKIDASYFFSQECRDGFKVIINHFNNPVTYGTVPSWEIFSQYCRSFPWVGSHDTVPVLCESVRLLKLRSQIVNLTEELQHKVNIDPREALAVLRTANTNLVTQHYRSNDASMAEAYQKLVDRYTMISSSKGLTGIPWPWQTFNEDTLGMQKGNFILFAGIAKNMKSWMALYTIVHAYLHNMRCLVFSLEMSTEELLMRCASIIANVDYTAFKCALLDTATYNRVFDVLRGLKAREQANKNARGHNPILALTQPGEGNPGSLSSIQAKIKEFEPDLVLVDGIHLLQSENSNSDSTDWKVVASNSRGLKRIALSEQLPIIGVTQLKRPKKEEKGMQAGLEDMGYSFALGQDADLVLQTMLVPEVDEVTIFCIAARDSLVRPIVVGGRASMDLGFKRMYETKKSQAARTANHTPINNVPQAPATPPMPTFR